MLKNLQFDGLYRRVRDCCNGLGVFKKQLEEIKKSETEVKRSDLSVDFMKEAVIEQLHLPPNKDDLINTEELYELISSDLSEYNVLFEALDQIFKDKYSGTEEKIDVDDIKLEKYLELFSTTNHMIKKVIDQFVVISREILPVVEGDLPPIEFSFENRTVAASEMGEDAYGDFGINGTGAKANDGENEFDEFDDIDIPVDGFRDEEEDDDTVDGFDPSAFIVTDDVDSPTVTGDVDSPTVMDDVDSPTVADDVDSPTVTDDVEAPTLLSSKELKTKQALEMRDKLLAFTEQQPDKVTLDLEALINLLSELEDKAS